MGLSQVYIPLKCTIILLLHSYSGLPTGFAWEDRLIISEDSYSFSSIRMKTINVTLPPTINANSLFSLNFWSIWLSRLQFHQNKRMVTTFSQQTRLSMHPYSDIVRIGQRGSQKHRVMGERWWWGWSRDHNSCWWFTVGSKLVMAMWTTSTVTRYRVYVSITRLICISLKVFHKHIFLKRFIVKVIYNDYITSGYLCFTRGCAAKRSK